MKKNIGIAGVGLIGGSIAMDLTRGGEEITIRGTERSLDIGKKALEKGLVHELLSLEEMVKESEIIIVATPPDVTMLLLPEILSFATHQTIIDVASVKGPILDAVKDHKNRHLFVAAHPMAGTEFSGPEAAQSGIFCQKACIFCDVEKSSEKSLSEAKELFYRLGMRIIYMDAGAHDRHAAYVSHISHITSFALALTVLEKEKSERNIFDLASGGFDSTVRLAKSEASMWNPVFRLNRKNMLDVIKSFEYQLSRFREAIENHDVDSMQSLIQQSNSITKVLKQN
jgi:prephenate dehydrogenase